MASQEIFIVVWIVVHLFLKVNKNPVLHGWVICGDLRYVYAVSFFTWNIIKRTNLLNSVFQFYLNLRLAAIVSIFLQFNVNLVRFTTINI